MALTEALDKEDEAASAELALALLEVDEIEALMIVQKEAMRSQFAGVEVEKPSVKIKKVDKKGLITLHFSNKM